MKDSKETKSEGNYEFIGRLILIASWGLMAYGLYECSFTPNTDSGIVDTVVGALGVFALTLRGVK